MPDIIDMLNVMTMGVVGVTPVLDAAGDTLSTVGALASGFVGEELLDEHADSARLEAITMIARAWRDMFTPDAAVRRHAAAR